VVGRASAVAAVEGEQAAARDAVFVALAEQDDDAAETALEDLASLPLAVAEALIQAVVSRTFQRRHEGRSCQARTALSFSLSFRRTTLDGRHGSLALCCGGSVE
jgi:hypothetical protein